MKNGSEVDFVIEGEGVTPVEVKYTGMNSPRLPSGIRSFMKEYRPEKAYVITKDCFGNLEVDNGTGDIVPVIFAPAYLLP